IGLAAALGLVGGIGLSVLRFAPDRIVDDVVPGAFAGLLAIWVLGPLVSVGSEGTLEVDKLALFPLTGRQLMPGLLLAAMVGAGGLTTVLIAAGAVIGTAPASPALVLTIIAAALEVSV